MSKTVVIDLDGTLCTELSTFERSMALPKDGAEKLLRTLNNAGYTIIIYTARSWSEFAMTEAWLHKYGLYYDVLLMGKPTYNLWIDDRAINCSDNLDEIERWIRNGN
jgi:phosphoglycolate phosphatase-like HAD superfamily hydrolase